MNPGSIAVEKKRKIKKNLKNALKKRMFVIQPLSLFINYHLADKNIRKLIMNAFEDFVFFYKNIKKIIIN